MKPKTKTQKRIAKLSESIKFLSSTQQEWIANNVVDFIGRKNKKGITCTNCNHLWQSNIKDGKICKCPSCGRRLHIKETRKGRFNDRAYCMVATTKEELQVLRFFDVRLRCSVNKEPYLDIYEVVREFIYPDGKSVVMARLRTMYSNYYDTWVRMSDLEIRPKFLHCHNIYPYKILPKAKYVEPIKRCGFKGQVEGVTPHNLFTKLLAEYKCEVLLKWNQPYIINWYDSHYKDKIDKYWKSIRVCSRHKYMITDCSMWLDYMDLLRYFGKDILNPKYICPQNLKDEHDRLVWKKRNIQKMEQAKQYERKFLEEKAKFFDLKINDDLIVIEPLKSIQEFKEEGDIMKHCVFTNEYFKRKDSLLLSARIGNTKLETIEFSLKEFDVVQAYGIQNTETPYHKRIVSLVRKNKNKIKSIAV